MGYLTTFDEWIFAMYTLLAMFVVLHQIVIVLERKAGRVPLRSCIIRVIEFAGRVFVAPITVLYYMFTFMDPTWFIFICFIFFVTAFVVFIGTREWGGLKKAFVEASKSIQDKLDENEKPSKIEMFLMNLLSFGILSVSTKAYNSRLSRKERRAIAAQRDIEMKTRRMSEAQMDSDDDE